MLSRFKNIPPKLNKNLNIGIQRAIMNIQRETVPITPFDTGRLRGSLKGSRGTKFRNLYGELGTDVEYALKIHEGTTRYPLSRPPKAAGTKRQFLKIGTERATPRVKREFKTLIERALK